MGWIADYKAKRADKAATEDFNRRLQQWQTDVATLEKIIAVFTSASKGEDGVENTLTQGPGERTLWKASGIFHETGRTPSHYVGRSSGVSIPIAAGIRFRVGATQGEIVPGHELQMDKDEGIVLLTTERLIFVGPNKTQQWDFDKLLMASCSEDEADYTLNVSNRQKSSGVRFDPVTGREFNRFLGSAIVVNEKGYEPLLKEFSTLQKEAQDQKPVLTLPSAAVAPLTPPGVGDGA